MRKDDAAEFHALIGQISKRLIGIYLVLLCGNQPCLSKRTLWLISDMGKLAGSGLVYHGMELLGGGAVLAGLVLGALAAFIIEHKLKEAGFWALAGAVLAFFGFIHGTQLGWAMSPQVALGYLLFAAVCFAAGMSEKKATV